MPLYILKAYVSLPRLFDIYLRDFPSAYFFEVGDSYLSRKTILADLPQKTYGISLYDWEHIKGNHEDAGHFSTQDYSVSRVQVWPFDPKSLSSDQLTLAVAVSYSDLELYREPRLCGALRCLLVDYDIEPYCELPVYG